MIISRRVIHASQQRLVFSVFGVQVFVGRLLEFHVGYDRLVSGRRGGRRMLRYTVGLRTVLVHLDSRTRRLTDAQGHPGNRRWTHSGDRAGHKFENVVTRHRTDRRVKSAYGIENEIATTELRRREIGLFKVQTDTAKYDLVNG